MSRRITALTCGLFALPALISTPLLAEAAPAPTVVSSPAAAKKPVKKATTASTKKTAKKTSAKKTSRKAVKKAPVKKKTTKRPVTKAPAKKRVAKAAPSRSVFTSRVVAGPGRVTDRARHTWERRPATLGSWRTGTITGDVARTTNDVLYRKTAPGVRWYRLQVPAAATYRVRMLFSENYFGKAGQRVFDVKAEGKVIASNVDIVKRVGKNAAYDVTATVPVRDGRLDLDFVAKKDLPIISGVEVTSTAAVAPARAARRSVALSPHSFYYTDISKAPLAANSAAASSHLLAQVKNYWGGTAAFNAYRFNNSFYEVPATQPKVRVNFYDCQRKGYTPAGLYDGPRYFENVPMPANAVPAAGTDKELTIYDRSADKLWEFWVTEKQPNGTWRACWGGRIDNVSKNQGVFPSPSGATASGLAMAPGVISLDEFRRGRIDHAMYLAIMEPAKWANFSWPANRTDGHSTNPNALMEGQRVRLDPKLDLSTIPMTPVARMVAEAAQKYGFVVTDKAGAVAVVTESGNAEKARTGVNPWDSLLAGPDYQAMEGFPWESIQVLPKNYGKPTK